MIIYNVEKLWFVWDEKRVISFGPFTNKNEAEKYIKKQQKKCFKK